MSIRVRYSRTGVPYGPVGITLTMTNTLKGDLGKDWMTVRTASKEKDKVYSEAYGWEYICDWVQSHLHREVIDEELSARQVMLSGQINQGSSTVTDFINRITRGSRKITNITEYDKIIWFLNGLSKPLAQLCVCDVKGRTWVEFSDLREHALAKEMELNARQKFAKAITNQEPFGVRKARFNQERSKHNPSNTGHSLAYTNVQDEGNGAGKEQQGKRPRSREPAVTDRQAGRTAGLQFKDDPEAPCPMNQSLSNKQGNWLFAENRCLFCGQMKHPKGVTCPRKAERLSLKFLAVKGLPINKLPRK